jgi:hypothetical protein
MKTLKVITALLLLSGLAINNLMGQKPIKNPPIVEEITLPFACLGIDLVGDLTFENISLNNHGQSRIYGEMTGTDGLTYYFDGIHNVAEKSNWDEWGEEAITTTWPGNYLISRDGKLIGVVYFTFHMTVNANGEFSVYRGDVYEYSCVGEGKIK